MKLGIIGSRTYTNKQRILKVVEKYASKYEDLTIISGGCPKGGDAFAKEIALDLGLKYVEFPPIHAKYNQYCQNSITCYNKPYNVRNFFDRNTEIAENCDHLLAFKHGVSKGTMDTVEKAKNLGKVVLVFEDSNAGEIDTNL